MKKIEKLTNATSYYLWLLFLMLTLQLGATGTGGDKSEFKGKWQIEIYGSFSNIAPGLNDLARGDEQIRDFFFEERYQYLENNSELISWEQGPRGEFFRIKHALSQGFRLKYHLSGNLAISFGLQVMRGGKDSKPDYEYTHFENPNSEYTFAKKYFLYKLSVSNYSPQLGIHYNKKILKKIELEGYVYAGPVFAKCGHFTDWRSSWHFRRLYVWGWDTEYLLILDSGSLEMNGSGTGLALEAGLRFNFPLGSKVGLFLEGGYSYTQVTGISGSGREVRNGVENTWQGEWAMKLEEAQAEWGNLRIEFPSNYWPSQEESKRIGDFTLDLSGFQLRAGFFFRF